MIIKTDTKKTPTFEQYQQLYSSYSQTLTCPCKHISTNYAKFIHIKYTLHQVCNSIFVTQDWIDYLAHSAAVNIVFNDDFRRTGTFTFQALNTSCQLVNQTIFDSLTQFYLNQYISTTVTHLELFQPQIEASVEQFRLSTTNTFLRSLNVIRSTTQANALYSAAQTNYEFHFRPGVPQARIRPRFYSDCYCDISATCVEPSTIKNYPDVTSLFYVPGIYRGCYIFEALLQSSLECFYNQTCIDQIELYSMNPSPINIVSLNSSLTNEYMVNSTVKELLDKLMIEEWNSTIIFKDYYNHCQPIECNYTYRTKNGILYIITTLFGLTGGLITVLKFVVPKLVKFIGWILSKYRRRIVPEISIIQT